MIIKVNSKFNIGDSVSIKNIPGVFTISDIYYTSNETENNLTTCITYRFFSSTLQIEEEQLELIEKSKNKKFKIDDIVCVYKDLEEKNFGEIIFGKIFKIVTTSVVTKNMIEISEDYKIDLGQFPHNILGTNLESLHKYYK